MRSLGSSKSGKLVASLSDTASSFACKLKQYKHRKNISGAYHASRTMLQIIFRPHSPRIELHRRLQSVHILRLQDSTRPSEAVQT